VFDANQASVSPGLSAILSTIKSYPKISRKQLAEKVLAKLIGEKSTDESSEQYQRAKTTLATDLIWLAKAGHVIEFADGTLDLPLPPRPLESAKGAVPSAHQNLEGEEADISPEEESANAQLETDEMPADPEPELTAAATGDDASQIAPEERESNLESSLEPAKPEVASEPTLKLSTEPPELLETQRESLERVASHSS
jgi:hypothetical protein